MLRLIFAIAVSVLLQDSGAVAAAPAGAERDALNADLVRAQEAVNAAKGRFDAGAGNTAELEAARRHLELIQAEIGGDPMSIAQARLAEALNRLDSAEQKFKEGLIGEAELKTARDTLELRKTEWTAAAWRGMKFYPDSEIVALQPEWKAYAADLVVVARVVSVGEPKPAQDAARLEGPNAPGAFVECKVAVTRIIRDRLHDLPAGGANAPEKEIAVVSPAAPASPAKSPAKTAAFEAPLAKDKTYVLVLFKDRGRDAYVLSLDGFCAREADEASVAKMEKLAAPDNWPWGKEVNGLQLALLTPPKAVIAPVMSYTNEGKEAPEQCPIVPCCFAFRNRSKQAIHLYLSGIADETRVLVSAADAPAKGYHVDRTMSNDIIAVVSVAPGEAVVLNPAGGGGRIWLLKTKPLNGRLTLRAEYRLDEDVRDKTRLRLKNEMRAPDVNPWVGVVESSAVEVEPVPAKDLVRQPDTPAHGPASLP